MEQFLPYAYQSINDQDRKAVLRTLEAPAITRGPQVEAFEKALADYTGATYAVTFNSGSTALQAAYFAAETGSYDTVLTTPNTFISSLGSALLQGAAPRFVDIDLDSGNLNLEQTIENLNLKKSRGKMIVVPVHFAGIAVDMQTLEEAIKQSETIVIEDAAHAIGSTYPSGEKVGSCAYSDMTILSFHPAKTITTGEGGAVTTNNPRYFERLKLYRNNGIVRDPVHPWSYAVTHLSSNFHLNEMQAALGLSQLKRIETFIEKRRALMARYRHQLADSGIRLFNPAYASRTAYHLAVVQLPAPIDRTALMQALQEAHIGTQYHYIPLYRHPAVSKLTGDLTEAYPQMERYFQTALSLPLYYDLTEEQVDYVAETLKKRMAL